MKSGKFFLLLCSLLLTERLESSVLYLWMFSRLLSCKIVVVFTQWDYKLTPDFWAKMRLFEPWFFLYRPPRMSFQGKFLQGVRKFVDVHSQKKSDFFLEFTIHAGVFELRSRFFLSLNTLALLINNVHRNTNQVWGDLTATHSALDPDQKRV